MNLKKILIFGIIILLFNDCSYQKRLYQRGYYITWNYHKEQKIKKHSAENKNSKTSLLSPISPLSVQSPFSYKKDHLHLPNNEQLLSCNRDNLRKDFLGTSKKINRLADDTSCGDKIILKSGDDYLVKIIEITDKEIKYKRCDYLNGPLYSISKSKVYAIIYQNGIKENITEENEKDISNIIPKKENKETTLSDKKGKEYPPSYFFSWVLFIAGFFTFLTWIPAMYVARQAQREIKQNPDKYQGHVEMGCLMYFCLTIVALTALLLLAWGIILLMISRFSFPAATVMAAILIIAGLLLGGPVVRFFKTSNKSDFENIF